MRHVIGLDQGGSGTRAVICALDGTIRGSGVGPGACHAFDGMPQAMEATRVAIAAAYRASGIVPAPAAAFAGGYTGADWPDEYDLLREAVEELDLSPSVTIVNDSIVALRGGTELPYGAILVAGTGANCAVRAPDGREFIYHYYHDDDLQGGGAIGRAALKAIYRAHTGRPPQTSLKTRVLTLLGVSEVDALMRGLLEGMIPGDRIPDIAPLVFEEAEAGDTAARSIVIHFAEGCAELVTNGLQRLEMSDLDAEVVLSGGIFKADSPLLLETLSAELHRAAPLARLVHARYEPVVGGALLALERLNILVEGSVSANIATTARRLDLVRRSP